MLYLAVGPDWEEHIQDVFKGKGLEIKVKRQKRATFVDGLFMVVGFEVLLEMFLGVVDGV